MQFTNQSNYTYRSNYTRQSHQNLST